jgi:FdhE protein
MDRKTEILTKLETQIGEMIKKYPHSQNIFSAFKAILQAKKGLVEDGVQVEQDNLSAVDICRLQGGVPVCRQVALFHSDEPWYAMALTMIPAIQAGFAELADELHTIETGIRDGHVRISDYCASYPELDEEIIQNWATHLSIRPLVLHLLLINTLRPALERKAKNIAQLLGDSPWDKGYCPICGTFPDIAIINDKIAQRWLHCPHCRHMWRFDRVLCPYCEHEGKEEGTTYFFVEGAEKETAFTCGRCKRYLLTLNRVSDLGDRDVDVVSMGLTHLDVIMQEKGYQPLVFTEWNDFSARCY